MNNLCGVFFSLYNEKALEFKTWKYFIYLFVYIIELTFCSIDSACSEDCASSGGCAWSGWCVWGGGCVDYACSEVCIGNSECSFR